MLLNPSTLIQLFKKKTKKNKTAKSSVTMKSFQAMNLHLLDEMFTHSHKTLVIYRQPYVIVTFAPRACAFKLLLSIETKGQRMQYACKQSLQPRDDDEM